MSEDAVVELRRQLLEVQLELKVAQEKLQESAKSNSRLAAIADSEIENSKAWQRATHDHELKLSQFAVDAEKMISYIDVAVKETERAVDQTIESFFHISQEAASLAEAALIALTGDRSDNVRSLKTSGPHASQPKNSEVIDRIVDHGEKIRKEVFQVVNALQFHDLLRQLLEAVAEPLRNITAVQAEVSTKVRKAVGQSKGEPFVMDRKSAFHVVEHGSGKDDPASDAVTFF